MNEANDSERREERNDQGFIRQVRRVKLLNVERRGDLKMAHHGYVYVLDFGDSVYVGESVDVVRRLREHISTMNTDRYLSPARLEFKIKKASSEASSIEVKVFSVYSDKKGIHSRGARNYMEAVISKSFSSVLNSYAHNKANENLPIYEKQSYEFTLEKVEGKWKSNQPLRIMEQEELPF